MSQTITHTQKRQELRTVDKHLFRCGDGSNEWQEEL